MGTLFGRHLQVSTGLGRQWMHWIICRNEHIIDCNRKFNGVGRWVKRKVANPLRKVKQVNRVNGAERTEDEHSERLPERPLSASNPIRDTSAAFIARTYGHFSVFVSSFLWLHALMMTFIRVPQQRTFQSIKRRRNRCIHLIKYVIILKCFNNFI